MPKHVSLTWFLASRHATTWTKAHRDTTSFFTCISGDFNRVFTGSYFGGAQTDQARAIAFGRNFSSIVVGGESASNSLTTTYLGFSSASSRDAWVARFSRKTGGILSSVAFGRSSQDDGVQDLKVDMTTDRIYATGRVLGSAGVNSTGWGTTYPVKYGYDSTKNSTTATRASAYLAIFGADLSQCIFTYLAGLNGNTRGMGLDVQSNGGVHVVGWTQDSAFPVNTNGGSNINTTAPATTNQQAFHARFSNGLNLIGSSLIGGTQVSDTGAETAYGVRLFGGDLNNAIVVGSSLSTSLQVTNSNAPTGENGFAWILKFTSKPVRLVHTYSVGPKTTPNFATVQFNAPIYNAAGQTVTYTITGPARFLNGTQTTTAVVPAGSSSVSVKVFPNASISATSLVTVSASAQAVTVNNSFSVSP